VTAIAAEDLEAREAEINKKLERLGVSANGNRPQTTGGWPVLGPAARHGLIGEIVAAIEPHSEADPAGLLFALLTEAGVLIGPGPHAVADSAEHPSRLFMVAVGNTSKGRKGSIEANVGRVSQMIDPQFARTRRINGFGSGESLVDAVRGDAESAERRMLIIEPEFARLLNVAAREGSNLSPIIRGAWESGRLAARVRDRTKTSVVDGAHVSIVGHISADELRSKLTTTEVASGFANRFLFVCVRRSKLLPDGGNLADETLAPFIRKFALFAMQARKHNIIRRTPAAGELWHELYAEMAEDDPGGLLGAIIARDAAQTLRLSLIYALMDGAGKIDVEHVTAAWAAWKYCRASAAYVFTESLGDVVADTLLVALRTAGRAGLDGKAQHDLFAGHASKAQLEHGRTLLIARGLAVREAIETGGRPSIILRASECEKSEKSPYKDKAGLALAPLQCEKSELSEKRSDDEPPPLSAADLERFFADADDESEDQ
jgi:hypothetical protein